MTILKLWTCRWPTARLSILQREKLDSRSGGLSKSCPRPSRAFLKMKDSIDVRPGQAAHAIAHTRILMPESERAEDDRTTPQARGRL